MRGWFPACYDFAEQGLHGAQSVSAADLLDGVRLLARVALCNFRKPIHETPLNEGALMQT